MTHVWSLSEQYERWRRVELAVLRARAELGEIPGTVADDAACVPTPSVEEVAAVEESTRHDVVAFLQAWTGQMPHEVAQWVHRDLTSSDVVDTAQAVALAKTTRLLDTAAKDLLDALRRHALAHRATIRLGRTHGRAAEPDAWGHRVADFAFAVARCRQSLAAAAENVLIAKVSGPVGRYTRLDPRLEGSVAAQLGLTPASVATQVVMRDSLSRWMAAVAIMSAVCEAVALEVRHGQREEVSELFEPCGSAQIGSSSMPHKRNPITSEKICGLARVVRSLVAPVTEGIALWHERDISHSSVERVCVPQAAALVEHQLLETSRVIAGLDVDSTRMLTNLRAAGGAIFSSELLSILLEQGVSRWAAYELLNRAGDGAPSDFESSIRESARQIGVDLPPTDLTDQALARLRGSTSLNDLFERLAAL